MIRYEVKDERGGKFECFAWVSEDALDAAALYFFDEWGKYDIESFEESVFTLSDGTRWNCEVTISPTFSLREATDD